MTVPDLFVLGYVTLVFVVDLCLVFLFFFLRMKAERFPANVLNVTLFGKRCD